MRISHLRFDLGSICSLLLPKLRTATAWLGLLAAPFVHSAQGGSPQKERSIVFIESFESNPFQLETEGNWQRRSDAQTIDGSFSLWLENGAKLSTPIESNPILAGNTYLIQFSYRIAVADAGGESFALEANWFSDESEQSAPITAFSDAISPTAGVFQSYVTFGDVISPSLSIVSASQSEVYIDSVYIFRCDSLFGPIEDESAEQGFPRLAKRLWRSPSDYAQANETSLENTYELLSRFDLLVGFEGDATMGTTWPDAIREQNADIMLFPSIDLFGYRNDAALIAKAANANALWSEAIDPDWLLTDENGIPVIDAADPSRNLINPFSESIDSYIAALASHIDDVVLSLGQFDGIVVEHADRLPPLTRLSSDGSIESLLSIDLDRNDIPDTAAELYERWGQNYESATTAFRNALGQTPVISQTENDPFLALAGNSGNGALSDLSPFPLDNLDRWNTRSSAPFLLQRATQLAASSHRTGAPMGILSINGKGLGVSDTTNTPLGNPDRFKFLFAEDLSRLRFGLANALLDNRYFAYDWVDASSPVVWFDEYAVAKDGVATGNRFGRGYLGQPLGEAAPIENLGQAGLLHEERFNNTPIIANEGEEEEFFRIDPANLGLSHGDRFEITLDATVTSFDSSKRDSVIVVKVEGQELALEINPELAALSVSSRISLSASFRPSILTGDIVGTVSGAAEAIVHSLQIRNDGIVLRRDFENGIVLLNASSDEVEISQSAVVGTLNRTRPRRIKGTQAPEINDGSEVTDGITLAAGDAIILLADRIANPELVAPHSLSLSEASSTSLKISLAGNEENQSLSHYRISYGIHPGSKSSIANFPANASIELTGLTPGVSYALSATAVAFSGRESPASETIIASTTGDVPPLGLVTGLSASEVSRSEALLINTSSLGYTDTIDFSYPYPINTDGLSVTFNDQPASILQIAPDSISVLVPDSLVLGARANVRIHREGYRIPSFELAVKDPNVATVGSVVSVELSENSALFQLDSGAIAEVSIVETGVARVRVAPSGSFRDWSSGATVVTEGDAPSVSLTEKTSTVELASSQISAIITKSPFSVSTYDKNGTLLSQEVSNGTRWRTDRAESSLLLKAPSSRHFFGAGLRGGPLDRRGERIQLQNRDFAGYEEFDSPLYSSIPYFLVANDLTFHGIFADMPAHSFIDFDSKKSNVVEVTSEQSEVDYYVLAGPLPSEVMASYHRLTGEAPLPPIWSLGYQQSRYGYFSWDIVDSIASGLRANNIPSDAIYLDIDWMQDYEPFTWNSTYFEDPATHLADLAADGFHVVTIVDPFVPYGGDTWDALAADNRLVQDQSGNDFVSQIFLGQVGWMDISNPETATWYRDGIDQLLDAGVSGIWNDLNEPADNYLTNAVFDYSGLNLTERESRNIYALTELAQTYQAMEESATNERPFILTRAGYAGFHRYAANWSGDTGSSFDALRVSVQTSLHMSLSGSPFFGHDIGGFLGSPTPELFTRWLQFASYTPFFRNHAHRITELREPWQFDESYTDIARKTIEQRYRLLPYWYSLFEQAKTNGSLTLGPTFTRFPYDPNTFSQSTEFMVGPYLLVAPVIEPGAVTRTLYLPAGYDWYDRRNNQRLSGGQTVTVYAPLNDIPVFARADAIIPSGPVRQYATQELESESITFDLYPTDGEGFTLYEDDGTSLDYKEGTYLKTHIAQETSDLRKIITFDYEGSWNPGERDVWINIHDSNTKSRFIVIDGNLILESADFGEVNSKETAWLRSSDTGILTIKAPFGINRITVLHDEPVANAIPHLLFADADGDLQGSLDNAFIAYTNAPIYGLVGTSGDTNDNDYSDRTAVAAKGSREIGLGLGTLEIAAEDLTQTFEELGIGFFRLPLSWRELEIEPGVYSENALQSLQSVLERIPADLPLHLSLGPISEYGDDRPDDLQELEFNDASTNSRFSDLVDRIADTLGERSVVYVSLAAGIEAHVSVDNEAQFISFATQATAKLKEAFGSEMQVGIDIYFESVEDESVLQLVSDLESQIDWFGIRLTPLPNDAWVAYSPTIFKQGLTRLFNRFPDTKFQLIDLRYPSSSEAFSSSAKQVYFIRELFALWDEFDSQLSAVSFDTLADINDDAAQNEKEGIEKLKSYQAADDRLIRLLTSTGILSASGEPKPAYFTLRNALFERQWSVLPTLSNRSIRIGLTTDPYDLDPGSLDASKPFIDEVMDEIFAVAHESGEMVEYHFDKGVPWSEALNDSFESDALPYSQNVRSHWEALRSREGDGLESIVSINALGLPRKRPAAYWGFGEGFYQDENGDRVANGIFQDYNQRIPPGLWPNRKINHESTKKAYLNYAKRAIDYFQPEYLNLAIEANEAIDGGDAFFASYLELHAYVYEHLKADPQYSDTKIITTFSAEFFMRDELGVPYLLKAIEDPDLVDTHFGILQSLLPYTDVVGLSLHPIKMRWPDDVMPIEAFTRLLREMRQVSNLPLAITETGYPADSFTIGDLQYQSNLAKQQRYWEMLLNVAELVGGVDFILNYGVRDFTPRLDKLRQRSQEDPPFTSPTLTEFFQIFESIGLYEENGDERPMTQTWHAYQGLDLVESQVPNRFLSLYSPQGKVRTDLIIDSADQLYYTVFRDGIQILERSPLGITLSEIPLGSNGFEIELIESQEHDSTHSAFGAFANQRNHYIAYLVKLSHEFDSLPDLSIEFRLYDDGVAYRYQAPASIVVPVVSGEQSAWRFPENAGLWFQDNLGNYEGQYRFIELGLLDDEIGGQALVTLPASDHYLLVSEASLQDYSGMILTAKFIERSLTASFLDDATWDMEPLQWTPWRYTAIAKGLNELVHNAIAPNLNPDPDPALFPQGALTRWIRPGRALWSWWTDPESGADFERQMQFVDYAAQNGIEFVVVDIHWEEGFPTETKNAFERLKELVDFAHSDGREVDIWVWKDLDQVRDSEARHTFLESVKSSGAVGVKFDLIYGVDSESQENVRLHEAILEETAALRLMVNFHGTHKANGRYRSYPHEITREGFSGLENNGVIWEDYPELLINPRHNAALPFVRIPVGPADYTPVTLDSRKTGNTTFAHQLALVGLMVSPLTHYADDPELLFGDPIAANYLSHVPTVWDESIVLPRSLVGSSAIIARRSGLDWWLFAINGSDENELSLQNLDFGFLSTAFDYTLSEITDAAPTELASEAVETVRSSTRRDYTLLPGGGLILRFRPDISYQAWRAVLYQNDERLADPLSDPDQDGLPSYFEYALKRDPLLKDWEGDQAIKIYPVSNGELRIDVAGSDNASDWADITFLNWDDSLRGFSLSLESSMDGETWTPVTPESARTAPAYWDRNRQLRQPVYLPDETTSTEPMLFRLSIKEAE